MKDFETGAIVELNYTDVFGIGEVVRRVDDEGGLIYYVVYFSDYDRGSAPRSGLPLKHVLVHSDNLKLVPPLVCLARTIEEDGDE